MKSRSTCCVFVSSIWIIITISFKEIYGQISDNTPPTMWLDRNWRIPDNEEVGNVIIRVHGSDNEDDRLEYGLEQKQSTDRIPFRIDNKTGVVYLNESLKGRAGENMFLYVTVSDGHLAAKTEVWVNVVNSSAPNKSPARIHLPPAGLFNLAPPTSPHAGILPTLFHPRPYTSPQPPIPTQFPDRNASSINDNDHLLSSIADRKKLPEEIGSKRAEEDKALKDPEGGDKVNEVLENGLTPQDQPVKSVPDLTITLVPVISVCAIFLAVGFIALLFRKKICLGRTKNCKEDLRKEPSSIVVQEDLAMQQWRGPRAFSNRYEPWEANGQHQVTGSQLIACADRWEFSRHRLKFFNILGEGAFGQVWKCEATDIDDKEGITVVAVKTLKENATDKERKDLISELQVMKMLEPHPNVVRLLGACTEKDPIFVIMEFVSKGKLQSYLRNSRAERYYNNMHGHSKSLTSRDLTSFVYQVAKGMEFLAANGIIHRDLAARNVLINDEHTCKVADFGFARDVIDSHVYERKSEGRLPIRWMPPESLYDNIFSTKSDVWSFGVLMWEVVTLGSTPYPGLSAVEVMRKVRDGHRLDKPEHCRRELYNIMYYCWDKDPKERPSFTECVSLLEKLLMTETDYIELERFPDHSYYNMHNISDEKL